MILLSGDVLGLFKALWIPITVVIIGLVALLVPRIKRSNFYQTKIKQGPFINQVLFGVFVLVMLLLLVPILGICFAAILSF